MTRQRWRCPRGERLVAAVPHGHWRTSTFVAALRSTGLTAPLVLDGAMNGDAFRAYIEKILVPTLAPGDIVIMDNLASHKVAGIRDAIEACGASLLYLPPYGPDLNPIEQSFSELKALIQQLELRHMLLIINDPDNLGRIKAVVIDQNVARPYARRQGISTNPDLLGSALKGAP